MIIYIMDRSLSVIGTASTSLPEGLRIQDDQLTRSVSGAADSFECSVSGDSLADLDALFTPCNSILVQDGEETLLFGIISTEYDTEKGEMKIYAESGGLDLLNDMVGDLSGSSKGIAWYLQQTISGTLWEVGINEIDTLVRTLSYDSSVTVVKRIEELASAFGAEVTYSVEMDGLAVTRRLVNVFQRIGKDVGRYLRAGREIESIEVQKSAEGLATAVLPVCNDANLSGVTYDDGDMYVSGGILYSRDALSEWARAGGKHIIKRYDSDAKTASTLLDGAKRALSNARKLEVTYDVSLAYVPDDVGIGDRVYLVDEKDGIYLSARMLELEVSETRGIRKATLGEIEEVE